MSGAYGHSGRDRRKASDLGAPDRFKSARGAYPTSSAPPRQPPPPRQPAARPPQSRVVPSAIQQAVAPTPPAPRIEVSPQRALKTTAKNVVVCFLDGTASLGAWRAEIWARVEVLHTQAKALLGDDLEIIFGTFGDLKWGDTFQVGDPGRDNDTLDPVLETLDLNMRGGNDGVESLEIPAYYLLKRVDVSSAQNVYAFFITDEGCARQVASHIVGRDLGISCTEPTATQEVFKALTTKLEPFIVLRATNCYPNYQNPNVNPDSIRDFWTEMVGRKRILDLDDGRRIVDTMLAAIATKTGQTDAFKADFSRRNKGSRYAGENLRTVMTSVAFVKDGDPQPPPPAPAGSSLLDHLDDER